MAYSPGDAVTCNDASSSDPTGEAVALVVGQAYTVLASRMGPPASSSPEEVQIRTPGTGDTTRDLWYPSAAFDAAV